MTIELQVSGTRYTNFTRASVNLRLDALSNSFDFEATSQKGEPLPFRGKEPCKVIVDGEVVITGFIEIVEVGYDDSSHNISIAGRDKTGDLIDSTLDSISDISAPITLKRIIEKVIEHIKADISVIDEVSPPKFEKASDIISPEVGENAFEFLEKYARKRQVLLTSNGDGNIVISSSNAEKINSPIRNVVGGQSNNVLKGNVSYDTTGRYNLYKFSSSLNPTALNFSGKTSASSVVDQKGQKEDEEIREGRRLILIAEESFSDTQNKLRAEWEANIRKARGRVYSVLVQGFRNAQGGVWDLNKLVSVIDDFAGINANMLINNLTFTYDIPSGSKTSIGFVNQNAYTLSLQEPVVEEVGRGLFG